MFLSPSGPRRKLPIETVVTTQPRPRGADALFARPPIPRLHSSYAGFSKFLNFFVVRPRGGLPVCFEQPIVVVISWPDS